MLIAERNGMMAGGAQNKSRFLVNGNRMVGDIFTLYMNNELTGADIEDMDGVIQSTPAFAFSGMSLGNVKLPGLSSFGNYFAYNGGAFKSLTCSASAFNSVNGKVTTLITNALSISSNAINESIRITNIEFVNAQSLGATVIYDNNYISTVAAPKAERLVHSSPSFRNLKKCTNITLGTLSQIISSQEFINLGADLSADASGYKSTIYVGNTVLHFMGLDGFPWSLPTDTLIVCSDGHIRYDGSSWVVA